MEESGPRYSREYVDVMTSLEHIRTRLQSIDATVQSIQGHLDEHEKQCTQNRMDVARIKTSAMIVGGLAGSVVAGLIRWFAAAFS